MLQVANENKKQKKASAINTSIYVTDLPLDVTKDEIHEYFKKHGMITKSIDTGEPRIRMYGDDQGNFKGEALVSKYLSDIGWTSAFSDLLQPTSRHHLLRWRSTFPMVWISVLAAQAQCVSAKPT